MIDEKKIEEAASAHLKEVQGIYRDDVFGVSYPTDRKDIEGQIMDDFTDGAQWAIGEFKKSLWHDAQEMPKKDNPFVFVQECNGRVDYHVGTMLRPEDYAKNRDFWQMTKWCYVDDLLPKEGGEQ